MPTMTAWRAGQTTVDECRACKAPRDHTIIAVDAEGRPLRVSCDFCGSQHNYRGGWQPDTATEDAPSPRSDAAVRARGASAKGASSSLPLVSESERTLPPMSAEGTADIEMLLRRIIREEIGLSPVAIAERWRGGQIVLRPGKPGVQEKAWPVDTFFHKVVMLRNRLRTLEQQLNSSALPDDEKVKLQGYVTGCYGTLTSFNVLFAETDDQFRGSGGE